MEKVFKYKLDFYYQQSIIYLITLIVYAGFRGNFIENEFSLVFKDPILYIIIIFVVGSFLVLILNLIRNRKLIIQDDKIIFYNKFNRRELNIPDIEWIYIGIERSVKTAGRSQAVVIKLKGRLRLYRIRLGRYEHQKELMNLINEIAKKVPQKKKLTERIVDKF